MVTKRRLLIDYKNYLAEELLRVKSELMTLPLVNGPSYKEDKLQEMIDVTLSSYRHNYKETDFFDMLGSARARIEASDTIDELD